MISTHVGVCYDLANSFFLLRQGPAEVKVILAADPDRQRLTKKTSREEDMETSIALTARVIKQAVIEAR